MLVMGLDTALQRCSVAILEDGVLLAEGFIDMERGHAEHLAPMVCATLMEAGKNIADFDRIGVVVGPGGFTGVRVALSFARGLVIGTSARAVGVTSLAALAGNLDADEAMLIAPVIDARRGQVYAGLYDSSGNTLIAPFIAEPEPALKKLLEKAAAGAVTTIGSGAALLPDIPSGWSPSGGSDQIDAKVVARLAGGAVLGASSPSPLYLRPPDAKPSKPGPFANLSKA